MESDDVRLALAEARAQFDQGDRRAALKLLESLLATGKKSRDTGLPDELLPAARDLGARADPRDADGYRLLVDALEQNRAYFERVGPAPSRADVWAGRRRVAVMLVLCIVAPGLVIAATGNTNMGIAWTEIGLFASPVAFFVGGERWGASLWLCGVASLYVIGSAGICLLMVVVEASVSGAIMLGLLVALLAGAVALAGCIASRGLVEILVGPESFALAGIAAALALLASDDEGLHHVAGGAASQESDTDLSGLYAIWTAAAVLIVSGVGAGVVESLRRHE